MWLPQICGAVHKLEHTASLAIGVPLLICIACIFFGLLLYNLFIENQKLQKSIVLLCNEKSRIQRDARLLMRQKVCKQFRLSVRQWLLTICVLWRGTLKREDMTRSFHFGNALRQPRHHRYPFPPPENPVSRTSKQSPNCGTGIIFLLGQSRNHLGNPPGICGAVHKLELTDMLVVENSPHYELRPGKKNC